FVAIFWRAGDTFFADSIGGDMLSKLGAQESHGAPPGLYLLLFWVTFWPGAPLAGMAAPAVWRARRQPGAQYLLAWLIPSWIVFELVLTKLPHYVLPLYPAIPILPVGALERRALSRSCLLRSAAWAFLVPAGARALRNVGCVGPKAAAAGFQEPGVVFMTGTSTLLTDGSGAADFLGQGSCRFALVESRSERGFVQRAEAIGLRYNVATRIEGY